MNGFLIDAVAIRCCSSFGLNDKSVQGFPELIFVSTLIYLAEILFIRIAVGGAGFPVLLMVVWTLKRELRASGECLGMYRR